MPGLIRRPGHCRICSGHAGDDDRAHDLRRAHAPFRESRGDLRKPEHAVALIAKTFAITEGVLPPDPRIDRFARLLSLERGSLLGLATVLLGGIMLAAAVNEWRVRDFGRLNYAETMRVVVPGVTLAVLG